jgi:hypothetical protein
MRRAPTNIISAPGLLDSGTKGYSEVPSMAGFYRSSTGAVLLNSELRAQLSPFPAPARESIAAEAVT